MAPIDAILPDVRDALARAARVVLAAPPGAGKTTRVPLALLDAPWRGDGRIIVLSPRRVAARAAAAYMARLIGEEVGETIGFRVRLEQRISARTRVEIVTEGVFTRMILDDPGLDSIAAVVFDEFHERSLDADFGLALALESQAALRPDLRLVVMSATLDVAAISALLGDAPAITSEGRSHPVEIRYRPRDPRARLEGEVVSAVRAAMREEAGSALVFLPGAAEIGRVEQALRETLDPRIDILPLHGTLDPRAQDAAIAPARNGQRKVVLATSIAETSLTIEGVRLVIDSGLARRPRYEPGIGLTHLETVRASQAAITQRAGRAGRLEPGVVWRLWDEGETRALPRFDRPEILDADLSSLALDLAAWGARDPHALAWLDPPPAAAWAEASALLERLGARDAGGGLTAQGAALARLPAPPRLAYMLMRAAEEGDARLAARLIVLLTERGLGGRAADLHERLLSFAQERGTRAESARRLADRLTRLVGGDAQAEIDAARIGRVLARGFSDRVAKARTPTNGRVDFLMASGRAAGVDVADPLARAAFLVIADATGRADRANIVAAAEIAEGELRDLFAGEIETETKIAFENGVARGRRTRRLGRIVLSEAPVAEIASADIEAALLDRARAEGLDALPWDDAARQLRARVALLRAHAPDAWPDWSDAALIGALGDWLPLHGARGFDDLQGRLGSALENTLDFAQKRMLESLAPTHLETPAGGMAPVDYLAEGGPVAAARLQEWFGLDAQPAILGGRLKLTLHLLSPAGRVLQTTRDLPGFWRGSYAAVRADMRGRYPKHPWPDNPLEAPPTRRAKPRGS